MNQQTWWRSPCLCKLEHCLNLPGVWGGKIKPIKQHGLKSWYWYWYRPIAFRINIINIGCQYFISNISPISDNIIGLISYFDNSKPNAILSINIKINRHLKQYCWGFMEKIVRIHRTLDCFWARNLKINK